MKIYWSNEVQDYIFHDICCLPKVMSKHGYWTNIIPSFEHLELVCEVPQ